MFLIVTAIVTSLGSLSTQNTSARHILPLETSIAVIAAYFYSQFVDIMKTSQADKKEVPYDVIQRIRYSDWFITTPIMLFALCIMLAHDGKQTLRFSTLIYIVICNTLMLAVGYAGEIQKLEKKKACIIGFIFFALIFYTIYTMFIYARPVSRVGVFLFYYFVIIWTLYGIVYLMDDKEKNVIFNVLDMFAKAFVGIFFWIYFTKAAVVDI
jgi:bacteriorhodopsin